MADKYKRVYSAEEIHRRVEEMGAEISAGYSKNTPIIAVCVMKGAVIFYADLVKAIKDRDVRFGFVSASSYYTAEGIMKSNGIINMKFSTLSEDEIVGADVLIVEDIIDTGRTLKALKAYFTDKGAKSVKIATLLNKPSCRVVDIESDYNAFTLEGNPYIIGYGLDNAQMYRNLDGVYEIV